MKNVSLIFNIALLVICGLLFFQNRSNKKAISKLNKNTTLSDSTGKFGDNHPTAIAYVNLDSIQAHYDFFQKLKSEFEGKQKSSASELTTMQKRFQNRTQELQQKAATMSQAEQEKAMNEINKMQSDFQNRQQSLDQELMDHNSKLQQQVLEKIETYLKDYNKDHKYAYILTYEPGFMLYKDSTLNITQDVIKGLNAAETKK